jgi:DNA-binding response OmpR family regulator
MEGKRTVDDLSPSPIPQARILVVEDQPTTRQALAYALTLMGYEAVVANNGVQALAKLASSAFDVMLLDLHMPEMDGMKVMERVHKSYPALLVIVLTAYATLESAIAAVKAGAVDYLVKPSTVQEIETAIARALERRRERLRRQHLIGVLAETLEALQAEEERDRTAPPDRLDRFLQVGSVTLDQEKRLAAVARAQDVGSLQAELTGNEAALLAYLMQHPDTVFSCRDLAQGALGYNVSEREAQDIVRPHISRLRKKVELDSTHPQVIRTIRGKGYLFSAH